MRRLRKAPFPYVTIAAGVIEVVSRDGPSQLAIDDLDEISILTTDDGPQGDDVFWMLRSAASSLVVPWSAEGAEKLLPILQTLDGFDNQAVIEASSAADRAVFPVWKRIRRTH